MTIRDTIVNALEAQGRSRYWLAEEVERTGAACSQTVYRFLRGDQDTTTDVASVMLELLGHELKAKRKAG